LNARSRRVVVKVQRVMLKPAGSRAVAAHLRYLEREGMTRDGGRARAYDAHSDAAGLQRFEASGREDRHQFRLIVAPEDGVALDNLRSFTRGLMQRIEADLGTRLEWVAVDHWDTDNPHTHIVLRGKDETGHDLVIAREYITRGMRCRASELATEWLGPRTEREIREGLQREVEQARWTSLDQELVARSRDGVVNVTGARVPDRARRALLLGRLQRLASLGVAQEDAPGVWRMHPEAESTLRALAERNDIVRTLQRAFGEKVREPAIFDPERGPRSIVGRIAAKGLADELPDRRYLVIDALDGRGYYVALTHQIDLAEFPVGGIAEVQAISERKADRNLLALAKEGIYQPARHLEKLRASSMPPDQAEDIVQGHVRRLEALRRARIVQRVAAGVWRVPHDLAARGRLYDQRRLGGADVQLLTHLSIESQVRAMGATWLDRCLVRDIGRLLDHGFAVEVHHALRQREDFLIEHNLATRMGQRIAFPPDLLSRLRAHDIDQAAAAIATETGLVHRPVADGQSASGVYRRSLMLVSGRFALLDDGLGFSLVPWRQVIEHRVGQWLRATMTRGRATWHLTARACQLDHST
jgi:type IV secretory pathway VirD2 relaxase